MLKLCERGEDAKHKPAVCGRLESQWVTFPAACGVSPGHDQRLRQEARPGVPEAMRELPTGSLPKSFISIQSWCGKGMPFETCAERIALHARADAPQLQPRLGY